MTSFGNYAKGHHQSRTTQGLLDFEFAGAPQGRAAEDDEQKSAVKYQWARGRRHSNMTQA